MEEKKGKNIIIIILLFIIIILGSTFYYLYINKDKILAKCKCEKTNCIEQETKKNSTIKEDDLKSEEKNKTIDAAYSWTTTDNITTTVILFKNGKCIENNSMEYRTGEYEISDNKINMIFKADMTHDTPYTITYDILPSNNIKLSSSQSDIELIRMQ